MCDVPVFSDVNGINLFTILSVFISFSIPSFILFSLYDTSILLSTKQNDESGIIYITILYNNLKKDEELTEFYNNFFEKINSNVKVIIRSYPTLDYLIIGNHPMKYEKYEELIESTIVYDKCGLTNLRKERAKYFYISHDKKLFDVVTYNPPIIEKILKRYE